MIKRIDNFYIKDTSQAMRQPGGRELSDYETWCGFDRKDLEGMSVLDLGSGPFEKLDSGLKDSGVNARVISLNPDYSLGKYRKIINNQVTWSKLSVAGLGQHLPFANESFDRVYALTSLTYYANPGAHQDSAELWIAEICRVLKKGGEAVLSDIPGIKNDRIYQNYHQLLEMIGKLGFQFRIEEFRIKENNSQARFRLRIIKP